MKLKTNIFYKELEQFEKRLTTIVNRRKNQAKEINVNI